MQVLVLNCGSSSVKLALVDVDSGERILAGAAERVGTTDASFTMTVHGEKAAVELTGVSHRGVISTALDVMKRAGFTPDAVGHRVVHGGAYFSSSVIVDDDVLAKIVACSELAPLHNPASVDGVRAVTDELPRIPQAAMFDTAFHQTLPAKAFRYAVPEDWYRDHDVRRYGFHGISYQYVTGEAHAVLDLDSADSKLVVAHLGNGASVAAILNGRSIDTSMGLTPLQGLVMGTRSGDVDPSLAVYMAARTGFDAAQIANQLNTKSGLLGLSGLSNDMRTVVEAAESGNDGAQLALAVTCYRLAKYIASYVVPLGGIDALVFTGGIGENNAKVRALVLAELAALGFAEDADANAVNGRDTHGRVSAEDSITAIVVNTDEELLIARDTAQLAASL